MFTAELISGILEQITNVKIQLWNLGFVEAYENSILRGHGAVYIKAYGGTLCFSPRRSGSQSESKADDSVVTSRDKKGCNEECSSGVKF